MTLPPALRGSNEYISRLCRYPLLILDDFGMERGTEYGLEQVFNVIDSRYRSRKPLIVTTNLTLARPAATRRTPPIPGFMTACWPCVAPVRCTGGNFRQERPRKRTSWRAYEEN